MSDKDLIVLGAGPGGLAAAMEAASSGMRVVLINGSHLLGYGLHGAYKSKGMWELAKDLRVACKVGRGYAPSPSACVDFEQVYQQLTEGAEELSTMYLAQLSRLGIEFVPGFAHFVDPHTVEVEGRTFSGKYILVATGTRPRLLPGMVADGRQVLTSDHVVDLRHPIGSMTILGAGVIGCEFASIFAAFGVEVTLIDSQQRVLSSEDEDVSAFLDKVFQRSRVRVYQKRRVRSITSVGERARTELDDGTVIETDVALIAIGRVANADRLGLEDVGVMTNPQGYVKIDRCMRTTVPHIFAAGDVARRPDAEDVCLVHVAEAEGRHAVRAMQGLDTDLAYQHVPFIIFTHPMVAGVGDNETMARAKYPDPRVVRFENARNHRLHAMRSFEGFVKLVVGPQGDDRILGVRAVGPQADTLIGEVSVMIEHGIPYTALLRSFHAHPSLSESLQNAARVLAGRLPGSVEL